MRRSIQGLVLLPLAACLGGCWWGGIFNADITAQVNNKTDATINVVPTGDTFDDSVYEPQRQDIGAGKDSAFTWDAIESNPKLDVHYKGHRKIIDVDYDFWGWDEIDVETFMFVDGNG